MSETRNKSKHRLLQFHLSTTLLLMLATAGLMHGNLTIQELQCFTPTELNGWNVQNGVPTIETFHGVPVRYSKVLKSYPSSDAVGEIRIGKKGWPYPYQWNTYDDAFTYDSDFHLLELGYDILFGFVSLSSLFLFCEWRIRKNVPWIKALLVPITLAALITANLNKHPNMGWPLSFASHNWLICFIVNLISNTSVIVVIWLSCDFLVRRREVKKP